MNSLDLDRAHLKTLTILYVEDERPAREEMGYFLQRLAGTVLFAENGEEGLEAFKRHRPALVVSDILMPVMDGLKMASAIRDLDPDLPIIMTTAFERTDYLLKSIEIGIDKYVLKPVNMAKLTEAVLACAHRLRAEELLLKRREHEAELRHHEAFGLLAGGMAHDYNNLLQGVISCIDLARMTGDPDSKVMEFIDRAKKISDQARDLGSSLRILAKGGVPVMQPTAIGPLLIDTVKSTIEKNLTVHGFKKLMNTVMVGATVTPEFEIPPDLPQIGADRKQLALVFTHLTVNALEAMPSGGTLRVSARPIRFAEQNPRFLDPGEYLEIVFHDEGCGISPANLNKVFQPYFTTKERGVTKGMGLGLALCAAIVAKHGGDIRVESEPGSGTAFTLHFPVRGDIPAA